MRNRLRLCIGFLALSCSFERPPSTVVDYPLAVPQSFDSLPAIPDENRMTVARIALGKALFHDTRLSGDGLISCASCHQKSFAYADTTKTSVGVHGKRDRRNAPSLINVAYQKKLFMEGGVPNLEVQILAPFGNENEMDFTLSEAIDVLKHSEYSHMSQKAYGRDLDGFVISRAIAAFERSLISNGSRYDLYLAGNGTALSPSALRGMNLFNSAETSCSSCHSGFLFTDQDFHNVGLYTDYDDEGRARLTLKDRDVGKFKTPSLRNVALTAPYMHDGSIEDLEGVIANFNSGGHPHSNRDHRIRSLELSPEECTDLRNFLETLTDTVIP